MPLTFSESPSGIVVAAITVPAFLFLLSKLNPPLGLLNEIRLELQIAEDLLDDKARRFQSRTVPPLPQQGQPESQARLTWEEDQQTLLDFRKTITNIKHDIYEYVFSTKLSNAPPTSLLI
jgi:hypothetical protein